MGGRDVRRGDSADAFPVHVAGDHSGTEGDVGQDGRLGRGVIPFHVRGRVPLGVAQALGFG